MTSAITFALLMTCTPFMHKGAPLQDISAQIVAGQAPDDHRMRVKTVSDTGVSYEVIQFGTPDGYVESEHYKLKLIQAGNNSWPLMAKLYLKTPSGLADAPVADCKGD